MTEYTWSDLDKSNANHYGRGKPRELIDAQQEAELAWTHYDFMVDEYYDRHYGDEDYRKRVVKSKQAAEAKQAAADAIYRKYYGAEDSHLEAAYEDKFDIDF